MEASATCAQGFSLIGRALSEKVLAIAIELGRMSREVGAWACVEACVRPHCLDGPLKKNVHALWGGSHPPYEDSFSSGGDRFTGQGYPFPILGKPSEQQRMNLRNVSQSASPRELIGDASARQTENSIFSCSGVFFATAFWI